MSEALYIRHRPRKLEQIRGQPEAVKVLQGYFQNGGPPHALMFTGPSGCGKTTLAQIVRKKIGCSTNDFHLIDCPKAEPLPTIRDIERAMKTRPLQGETKYFFLEEAQSLSRATHAQQALLSMLENAPDYIYFALATTEPAKIHTAIHTRCTEIKLGLLKEAEVRELVEEVALKEKQEVSREVASRIAEVAGGSPRKALVLLEQVIGLEKEEDRLGSLLSSESKSRAIDLARYLMAWGERPTWKGTAEKLQDMDDEPETVRRVVLGYANSVLLKGGKQAAKAYALIAAFRYPFYDSGPAGLTAACWEVLGEK